MVSQAIQVKAADVREKFALDDLFARQNSGYVAEHMEFRRTIDRGKAQP